MAQNFLSCDRDQEFLLAPSVRDWLPEGHLAWFVLEVVERLDLRAIYGAYRADGSGRPAHEPAMMVALIVYAYCVGERSSRQVERRCVEDVALRVIAANRAPDHTTIARFRQRFAGAVGGVVCAGVGDVRGERGWSGSARSPLTGPRWPPTPAWVPTGRYAAIRAEVQRILDEADAGRRGRGRALRGRAR